MKRLIVVLSSLFITIGVFAQQDAVIMTIDGKPVTKSEFLQIYLKNNPDPKFDKASLDEYVELFKKFKLKVIEAEALGYDTIPKLARELNGYKKQLAMPYLQDSTKNEELVREAYDRLQNEVRASHILIKADEKTSPEDTLKIYNRLLAMKKRIENGEDFASIAMAPNGSEDPSVSSNGGDLGYFTAFQMVYPFEDAAFKTEIGKVSMPFRTRFGYHILMVSDKRPARGTMEAAHIMVRVTKESTEQEVNAARDKANEIYDLIEKGEKFEDLVKKYSDDGSTLSKGGILPQFGTGAATRMVPEFEDAAFELKNDGDVSKPIRTDFGFHIIKRISWKPVPSFEEMEKEIRTRVSRDSRSQITQASFVEKLKKEYGFKKKNDKPVLWFENVLDSTYYLGLFKAASVSASKPIFTLNGKKYTQQDFAIYLEQNYRSANKGGDMKQMLLDQYAKWEKRAIIDYESDRLPEKYPAYKALLKEYHDGILLYEVMSDLVWNKAMRDTSGLKAYYEENKSNYMWNLRYEADVMECKDQKIAEQVYQMMQNDTVQVNAVVKEVNKDSELNVRLRNGKLDVEKTAYLKDQKLVNGLNKPYEFEGKYYVVRLKEVIQPTQKEFYEAKGAVTSDYQNKLEKDWLAELEAKYPIVVNEAALYSLGE
ncbi:MAG: peptidylprolyl isomerase [Bacteroidetes bacterium]|nr:MAG: peptidylprolyl isomerase [Bacteroidota bacterium]